MGFPLDQKAFDLAPSPIGHANRKRDQELEEFDYVSTQSTRGIDA